MHLSGTRRARLLTLLLAAGVLAGIWRVAGLYVAAVVRGIGPTVMAEAQKRLHREVSAERVVTDRPGLVVVEGLRVSRGKTLRSGTLLEVRRAELRYDPALVAWSSLLSGTGGVPTTARFSAWGLRVHAPDPYPDEVILSTRAVSLRLDLRPLLTGNGDVLATIPRIQLEGAHARVARDRDGVWSFQRLLQERAGQPPTAFRGEIIGKDCSVDLADYAPAALPEPAVNRAMGDFRAAFAAFPAVQFNTTARVAGPHGGDLSLEGHAGARHGTALLTLSAYTRDLPYWYRYFVKRSPQFDLTAGAARVSGAFWWNPGSARSGLSGYSLALRALDGAARLQGLDQPVRGYTGRIEVSSGLVSLDGTASIAEVPFRLQGLLAPGSGGAGEFHLSAHEAGAASMRRLFPGLRLPDPLSYTGLERLQVALRATREGWWFSGLAGVRRVSYGDVAATGVQLSYRGLLPRAGAPQASGEARATAASYREYELRGVSGTFRSQGGLTEVEASGSTLGGTIAARGWADLGRRPSALFASGHAERLDASAVRWSGGRAGVQGLVDARFVVTGTTDSPRVSAYARARQLSYHGEELDEVTARIHWADGLTTVSYGVIRDDRFHAAFTGTVSGKGELGLRLEGRGLQPDRVPAWTGVPAVAGDAYVAAHIQGTMDRPLIAGRLQVYRPTYRSFGADYAEASFTGGLDRWVLENVDVRRLPETARAARLVLTRAAGQGGGGGGGPPGAWQVQGALEASGLSVVRALRLAGVPLDRLQQAPTAGEVKSLRLTVTGPLETPSVRYAVSAAGVAVKRIALGEVDAGGLVEIAAHRLSIEQASAQAPDLRGRLAGSIAWDPGAQRQLLDSARGDLQLDLRGPQLAPLVRQFVPELRKYVELSGRLERLSGSVNGSLKSPAADLDLRLADVMLDRRLVRVEPVHLAWRPEGLVARNVAVHLGSGRVSAPYLALLTGGEERRALFDRAAGQLEIEDVPVGVVLQLFEDSPYAAGGRVARVRELLPRRQSDFSGQLRGHLALSVPDAPPSTEGTESLLARLRSSGGQPFSFRGLSGRLEVPQLAAGPSDRSPTRLTATFSYRPGQLRLDELAAVRRSGFRVTVSGTRDELPSGADRLDLQFHGEGVRLAALARLTTGRPRELIEQMQPIDGTARADGRVRGDSRRPSADFSLSVEGPTAWGIPFDELSLTEGSYSAEAGLLRFGSLRLVKKQPGAADATLQARGFLPVSWPQLRLAADRERRVEVVLPEQSLGVFAALADGAESRAKSEGPEAGARIAPTLRAFRRTAALQGRMEGQLSLGGTADRPVDDGHVRIADGTVLLSTAQTRVDDFNARVDLRGDTLELTRFEGRSNYGGTFRGGGIVRLGRRPRLDLALDVREFKFFEKELSTLVGEQFRGSRVRGEFNSVDPTSPDRHTSLTIRGEWPAPVLAGGLQLDHANLLLNAQTYTRPTGTPLPGAVPIDLKLIAGKNVELRNQATRLKISRSLQVTRTVEQPLVRGDLGVETGTLDLPGMRLRNIEGTIRVNYDAAAPPGLGAPAPIDLDLTASTTLRVQRSFALEAQDYDVTVQIRGSPGGEEWRGLRARGAGGGLELGGQSGLNVSVTTSPPLAGGQIEALIRQHLGVEGFGGPGSNVVESLRGQVEQALAVNVSSALTGRLEDLLQSRLKLDVLAIDFGVTEPLRIRIGKRLFGKLYGTVTQELSTVQGERRAFDFYYRVLPQLRVGFRHEEPVNDQIIYFSGALAF